MESVGMRDYRGRGGIRRGLECRIRTPTFPEWMYLPLQLQCVAVVGHVTFVSYHRVHTGDASGGINNNPYVFLQALQLVLFFSARSIAEFIVTCVAALACFIFVGLCKGSVPNQCTADLWWILESPRSA